MQRQDDSRERVLGVEECHQVALPLHGVVQGPTFISPSGWVVWGVNAESPAMTQACVLATFSDPSTGTLVTSSCSRSSCPLNVKLHGSPECPRRLTPCC